MTETKYEEPQAKEMNPETKQTVVACLGSSSTAAKGPYDWIRDLERRPENAAIRFFRFAAGGDLAYNGVQRLPQVIGCHPDFVVILLGGNDVMASMREKSAYYRIVLKLTKRLPREPSSEWFRENVETIIFRLKSETSARIALCSLPPWGEDLGSAHPFQAELNRRFVEYNGILRDIATTKSVSYLPFYERMVELILASPGRAFTKFSILPFYLDTCRQYVLGKSNDEIAEMNGWKLHRDGIHLNSRSGKILADIVQEFILAS
jgi:lysophospholipase L1-like esterase